MSKTGPRELTNELDDSIVELCNPETGEIMPVPQRHDGGARLKKLVAAGWRTATDEDREAALERAEKNAAGQASR